MGVCTVRFLRNYTRLAVIFDVANLSLLIYSFSAYWIINEFFSGDILSEIFYTKLDNVTEEDWAYLDKNIHQMVVLSVVDIAVLTIKSIYGLRLLVKSRSRHLMNTYF